jgi:hypothetical protein
MARALHPAQLVAERPSEPPRREHVMNDVMREDHLVSRAPDFFAENIIVRVVIGCGRDAADRIERIASERHRRTKRKANALHHVSYNHA